VSSSVVGGKTRRHNHGVYRLNHSSVTFTGRDKIEVKRRALDYWYRNPRLDGHSLREFLGRCRLSADERMIVFHPW